MKKNPRMLAALGRNAIEDRSKCFEAANNKQGKYRIVYIVIVGIILFLILIMTFAPDSQQITGSSTAENQITGKIAAKSIFAISTKPKSARGMLGITGRVTGAGGTGSDSSPSVSQESGSVNNAGGVSDEVPEVSGSATTTDESTPRRQPPNEDQAAINEFLNGQNLVEYTFSVADGSLTRSTGSVLTRDGQVYVMVSEGDNRVLVTQAQRTGGLLTVLEGNRYEVVTLDKNGQIKSRKPLTQQLTPEQLQQIRTETQQLTRVREQIRRAHRTEQERIQLNQQYNMISQQFTGWLAGVISNELDKKLGSWSRGVPGKICQAAYGLEYDRPSGWIRVEPNASVYEAGQQMISHARTALISGEKEEITSTLMRYAYSLRLLGDTSIEWETYLRNSCTERDSKEQFYDQGALGPGDYFYMHYAGSEGNDMIFNCETEECIYDQACVKFADEQNPYCVDLVNGVGFITVPTTAYGCE